MKQILIRILLQITLDEEKRKTVFNIIIGTTVGLLTLIAFFYT